MPSDIVHRLSYNRRGTLVLSCRTKLTDELSRFTTWDESQVTCPKCKAIILPSTSVIEDLVAALEAAHEHLEYTGYGDSYERSCAQFHKLDQRISLALRRARKEAKRPLSRTPRL